MIARNDNDSVAIDRYPGLRPFVLSDRTLFFGRNEEILQITQSITVHNLFIVFGKSGLGKSSLINAGVSPLLAAEGYACVPIRFYNNVSNPLEITSLEIIKQMDSEEQQAIPADSLRSTEKVMARWKKKNIPILIFDQFEEFFFYPKDTREAFYKSLAILLNAGSYYDESVNQYFQLPPTKLVFLIRSDRMTQMSEMSDYIPGIFNNRFELKPMKREKAEQSLLLPAQISEAGPNMLSRFYTLPFEIDEESVSIILKTLANKENEIESSQLQIVCQELEEIAYRKQKELPSGELLVLTAKDHRYEEGIKDILNRFYFKQLEKLKNDPDLKLEERDLGMIRSFIENELISARKRVVQSEDKLKEVFSKVIPGQEMIGNRNKEEALIDKLVSVRLIKAEETHLGKVYEITHDTLVESILESKTKRLASERQNQLEEQRRELEEEKKRLKNQEKLTVLAQKARSQAEMALAEAEKAKMQSEIARQETEVARLKTRRRTMIVGALAGIVIVMFVVMFVVIRNQAEINLDYKNTYILSLQSSAELAHQYGDHATAFNAARLAGLKEGNFNYLDSLLEAPSYFSDYYGLSTEHGNVLASKYGNNLLQLFYLASPVRKECPSYYFENVEYYQFSNDNRSVAIRYNSSNILELHSLFNSRNEFRDSLLFKMPLGEKYPEELWIAADFIFDIDSLDIRKAVVVHGKNGKDSIPVDFAANEFVQQYRTCIVSNELFLNYYTPYESGTIHIDPVNRKSQRHAGALVFPSQPENLSGLFFYYEKKKELYQGDKPFLKFTHVPTDFEPYAIRDVNGADYLIYRLYGYYGAMPIPGEKNYPRTLDLKGLVAKNESCFTDPFGIILSRADTVTVITSSWIKEVALQLGNTTLFEVALANKGEDLFVFNCELLKSDGSLSVDSSRFFSYDLSSLSKYERILPHDYLEKPSGTNWFFHSHYGFDNESTRIVVDPMDTTQIQKRDRSFFESFYEPLNPTIQRKYGIIIR